MSMIVAGLAVHADDLVQGKEVAHDQGAHVSTMDRYLREHLSRMHAFRGVLALFGEQYAAAVEAAHGGLRASGSRAGHLAGGFAACRREFAEADAASEKMLDRLTETVRRPAVGKLEAEVDELRRERGAWGKVVELRDALGGLRGSVEDVRGTWGDVREEAAELSSTSADLSSYEEFVAEASR